MRFSFIYSFIFFINILHSSCNYIKTNTKFEIDNYEFNIWVPNGFTKILDTLSFPYIIEPKDIIFADTISKKYISIYKNRSSTETEIDSIIRNRIRILKGMNIDCKIYAIRTVKKGNLIIEYLMPNYRYGFKSYNLEAYLKLDEKSYVVLRYFTLGQFISSDNPTDEAYKVINSLKIKY